MHDLIGGLDVAQVEEPARQYANFAPPFIGVLAGEIFVRSGKHQLGGRSRMIRVHQPVKPAQRIAQVPRLARNVVEQLPAVVGICVDRAARLDHRDLIAAEVLGGAHGGAKVLGAYSPVHAGKMIGGTKHARWRPNPDRSNSNSEDGADDD